MTREHGREGGSGATWWRVLSLLALLTAGAAGAAEAQEVRWTGSTSYASGSYVFDARTHTVVLSNGLGLTWGRLDVTGSLPVFLQNSRLVSHVGGVPLPTGGEDHGVVGRRQPGETIGTHSGMGGGGGGTGSQTQVVYADEYALEVGDPFFTAAARLYEGTGFVRSFQVQGSTKAPLRGLDSGVGTGEWDIGAGASAFASLAARTYVFMDLSYWWYGDLPELELVDGLSYGVGVSRTVLDARGSLLLSFLGSDPIIDSLDRPASLGLGASYSTSPGRSVSGGFTVGLSESSPDFSVYVGWSVGIG